MGYVSSKMTVDSLQHALIGLVSSLLVTLLSRSDEELRLVAYHSFV